MPISFSIEQISQLIKGAESTGQTNVTLTGVNSLTGANTGDISFLANTKYRKQVSESSASVIILPKDYTESTPKENQVFIKVDNPSWAFALVCGEIERQQRPRPQAGIIHPTAIIAPDADVHATAHIGPYCIIESGAKIGPNAVFQSHVFIGRGVTIGENCDCMPHVTVMDYSQIGNRVRLHSGVVLGSDGFGYSTINGAHLKEPQIGIVQIDDDVEIGANTTIDRARFSKTYIGKGTKIDNLVQIGHNCKIGRGCFIISQVGISGSTIIEDYVVLAGQVGVAGHLTIGKGTIVAAQGGVNSSVDAGMIVQGTPVEPISLMKKIDVLKRRLPELFKKVANLEEIVESYKLKNPDQ